MGRNQESIKQEMQELYNLYDRGKAYERIGITRYWRDPGGKFVMGCALCEESFSMFKDLYLHLEAKHPEDATLAQLGV